MIHLNKIKYSYNKESLIFNEMSFSISKGEIISIIGRSGLGKTTLLNLISGLLKPEKGKIVLNNKKIDSPSLEIVYLKQNPTFLPFRNALENALLNIELRTKITQSKIAEVTILFEKYGLTDSLGKYPKELSEGMKQRIAIIQTLLVESEIYLFDEPFSAIDLFHSRIIENDIWDTIKDGEKTSLIVTHDIEQAVAISDKILLLSSNNHEVKIIDFKDDFKELSPNKRRNHPNFSKELYRVIKLFSEN